MNFLALSGSSYENAARGILYVIYEIIWKLIYYILLLIDEITKLFYKVAGINVNNGVIENRNMFDQLLHQNIVGTWYGIFVGIAAVLVVLFTVAAIIKAMASNESGERRSMAPILKNVGLALLLLIVIGPVILLLISLVSNIGIWIASIGGNNNISIADILFNNSGNLLTVYNETYGTSFTSFRNLGNDFLYDLMYPSEIKEGATALSFHWYIVLLGGGFVLYNLACIVIEIVKRIFNIMILYIASPFAISKMALDDGRSFKEWQTKFFSEFVLLLAQIGTFMIFVTLVNILSNLDFEGLASSGDSNVDDSIFEPNPGEVEQVTPVATFSLLNGLGRTLIIMAAVSVTRSSATMLSNLLTSKETKTENLLSTVIDKLSSRSGTTRTRTITRNTTTTKRETVFVEPALSSNATKFASQGASNSGVNNANPTRQNNTINQTVNVSNKFTSNNTINNRSVRDEIRKGNYSSKETPGNIYINASKSVDAGERVKSFKFMDSATTKAATNIIKEYTKANSNLSNAINSGDSSKISQSLNEYTKVYSKEADVLSDNYRKFEQKANNSMKSELSTQARQELKNISTSYRKAQMEYNRTANKLKEYDGERISTADALKIKEAADKQRETLMNASNKAAQFYENQKKGE